MASVDLEEKANFTRLSRLLVDKGTEALRDTLDTIHPPSGLPAVLNANQAVLRRLGPRIINDTQWDLLFPPSGDPPDSKTFDVTLTTVLLRNICGLRPPTTGWNTMPSDTDRSRQANVTRIRLFRNQVYAHVTSAQLDNATFEALWQKISQALVDLNIPQKAVDDLKTSSLGPEEESYVQQLEEAMLREDCNKKILVDLQQQSCQSNLQQHETIKKSLQRLKQVSEENRQIIQQFYHSGSSQSENKRPISDAEESESVPWKWERISNFHREKLEKFVKYGQEHPEDVKEINGVRVCCLEDYRIGFGSDGTRVYVGLGKDGCERAVKRLPKDICADIAEHEKQILMKVNAAQSNYVVNYWFLDEESDKEYLYLIMDLCEETLERFVDDSSSDELKAVAPEIIQQVLNGLADLHREPNRILHRDLKPSNILRNVLGKWLLVDFGISRTLTRGAKTHRTSQGGTENWRAVESYPLDGQSDNDPVRYKKESDIQAAGMVAFYIATKGEHVFGRIANRLRNLLDGKPVGLDKLEDAVLKDLLSWMLSHNAEDRPSAEEALKHPYFQPRDQQFEMLSAMGQQKEIQDEDKSSAVVQHLNADLTDWRTKMKADRVYDYLCAGYSKGKQHLFRYRKSWTECLRFIRNVKVHWYNQPRWKPKPKEFGDPQEYLLKAFPDLPLKVYKIVKSCDWKERPELREYFI